MFKRSALTIYLMLVISLLVVNSKSNMYQSIQNLTVGSSKIETMDITGNNDILAVGTYDNKVILYKNNDTRYQPYQEILFSSQVEAVDITNDGKYLLVVEYNGNAKIYKHNNTRDIFIVLQ